MLEKADAGQEEAGKEGFRTSGMQDFRDERQGKPESRDNEKEGCKRERFWDKLDAGQERMQENIDGGKKGCRSRCRTGGSRKEGKQERGDTRQ